MAKKISATNMVEKAPRSRKAAANVTGAIGAALAATFIAAFEAEGEVIEKNRMSRKDRLVQLLELSQVDTIAFHKAMMERAEQVKVRMEEEKKKNPLVKGLREFFELHPGQQTIYVQASIWQKLAKAKDAGWKPDMSMPWTNIDANATAFLNAKGEPSADPNKPQPAQSTARKQGRAPVKPQAKAVTAAVAALKDDKGAKLPKNNRNLAAVIEGILDADGGATLEELQEVAAVVQKKLDAAIAAQKVAAEALAKAGAKKSTGKEHEPQPQGDGTSVQKTSNGATVVRREAAVPSTAPSAADKLIDEGRKIIRERKSRATAKA